MMSGRGLQLSADEAQILQELDNRLKQVKVVKLSIPTSVNPTPINSAEEYSLKSGGLSSFSAFSLDGSYRTPLPHHAHQHIHNNYTNPQHYTTNNTTEIKSTHDSLYNNTATTTATNHVSNATKEKRDRYFNDKELLELNARIKKIEEDLASAPLEEDFENQSKKETKDKKTTTKEVATGNGRDEGSPNSEIYSSLLLPHPIKTIGSVSSRRSDYLPSDWTDEHSIMLPAPKLNIDELNSHRSVGRRKDYRQEDDGENVHSKLPKKGVPKPTSPLFEKRRQVSSFASPRKAERLNEDAAKQILPPDRQTKISSLRVALGKKEISGPNSNKISSTKTKQENVVPFTGSFSPPMTRNKPRIPVRPNPMGGRSDRDKCIIVDGIDKKYVNVKSDICITHCVKKLKGRCPVCSTYKGLKK